MQDRNSITGGSMSRPSPASLRRLRWIVICLAVVILIPAAIGFTTKLIQFMRTSQTDEHGGFAILPLVLYLTMSAGFLCLLLWAAFQGMFRDVEQPKFKMLETEERLNRAEFKLERGS